MAKVVFPSFSNNTEVSPYDVRQLVSALELRFQALESGDTELFDTEPLGDEYAPLIHTHTESDITDLQHISSIFELDDVTGTPAVSDTLVWNGAAFETAPPGAISLDLDDLNDVNSAGAADGQSLVYDISTLRWVPGDAPAGIDTLFDLTDTDLVGQVRYDLLYNDDGTEWQATGYDFQWIPGSRVQLGNAITMNWYDAASASVPFIGVEATAGVSADDILVQLDFEDGSEGGTTTTNTGAAGDPVFGVSGEINASAAINGSFGADLVGAAGATPQMTVPIGGATGTDPFNMQAGRDFTIMFDYQALENAGANTILYALTTPSGNTAWEIGLGGAGDDTVYFYVDGVQWHAAAVTAWPHHITWTKEGNNSRVFIDGTQAGSTRDVTSDTYESQAIDGTGLRFAVFNSMYIDNIVMVNNHALYTENFTPPTTVAVATGAEQFVIGDPGYDTRIDGSTTTVTGNFNVDGTTLLDTTLNVTGATTLGSTLGVTGVSTLNNDLILDYADPTVFLRDSSATADEGNWIITSEGDEFRIATASDATPDTEVLLGFGLTRSGTSISNLNANATIHRWNDATGSRYFEMDNLGPSSSLRMQIDVPVAIQNGVTNRPSLYIQEQADAVTDFTGYGQWWVRDDQTPMFTTELGANGELGRINLDQTVTATWMFAEGVQTNAQVASTGINDVIGFMDVFAGTTARFGAYNWGLSTWQPVQFGASTYDWEIDGTLKLGLDTALMQLDDAEFRIDARGSGTQYAFEVWYDDAAERQFFEVVRETGTAPVLRMSATATGNIKFIDPQNANDVWLQFVTGDGADVRIRDGYEFRIYDATDLNFVAHQAGATDFTSTFTNQVDWDILGLTGEVFVDADLRTSGDLTVGGTTTTINSNTVSIADNIILLNSDEVAAPTQDAGIEIERGTSANVQFLWDETNDTWLFDQPTAFQGGAVGGPGIAWAGDLDTGFYQAGAGSFGVAVNGANTFNWNPTYTQSVQEFWSQQAVSVNNTVSDVGQTGVFGFIDVVSGTDVRVGSYNYDVGPGWEPIQLSGSTASVNAQGDGSFNLPGDNTANFTGLGDRLNLFDGMDLYLWDTTDNDSFVLGHNGTDATISFPDGTTVDLDIAADLTGHFNQRNHYAIGDSTSYVTHTRTYNIAALTSTPLLNREGANYGATGDKELICYAYTSGTGTNTAAVGVFRAINGAAWALTDIYEYATGSNNPNFLLDGSGFPAIENPHPTTTYNFEVKVEETNNNSRFGEWIQQMTSGAGGGILPTGTVTDSTLRWSGSAWLENTFMQSDGTDTLAINSEANSVTQMLVGEPTTLRGNSQDARIILYGEQASAISNYQMQYTGSNMQFTASSTTSNVQWSSAGTDWAFQVRDGGNLELYDGDDSHAARFLHDGTNFFLDHPTGTAGSFRINDFNELRLRDGADFHINSADNATTAFTVTAPATTGDDVVIDATHDIHFSGMLLRAGDNNSATTGQTILEGWYTGDNVLNVWGSERSSGATVMAYGVRPRDDVTGFESSAGNAAFERGVFDISGKTFTWSYANSSTTAIGTAITMTSIMSLNDSQLDVGNYSFDINQTVGAGQDNYVLTYDNGTGQISLEAAAGGGIGGTIANDQVAVGSSTADEIEGFANFTYNGSTLALPSGAIDVDTVSGTTGVGNRIDGGNYDIRVGSATGGWARGLRAVAKSDGSIVAAAGFLGTNEGLTQFAVGDSTAWYQSPDAYMTLDSAAMDLYVPLQMATGQDIRWSDALQPWLTLDSSSSGDNWTNQGAGISVGESGKKGSAAIHMTYNGDGSGYVGMGAVNDTASTGGRPGFGHIDFTYNNNVIGLRSQVQVTGTSPYLRVYDGTAADYVSISHDGTDAIIGVPSGDGALRLQVAGTENAVVANENSYVSIYHNNSEVGRTNGLGGMQFGQLNNVGVDYIHIYHDGSEAYINAVGSSADLNFRTGSVTRARCQVHTTTGETSGMELIKHDGVFYDVGFNQLPVFNDDVSDTLEAQHCGAINIKDGTTARTLTLEASSSTDFPVSGVTQLVNAAASGNWTVNEGSGTTLYYIEPGTGIVDTAGGCTVGPGGVVTIWRRSGSVYWIWGSEITA